MCVRVRACMCVSLSVCLPVCRLSLACKLRSQPHFLAVLNLNDLSFFALCSLPSVLKPSFDLCFRQPQVLREFHSLAYAQVFVILQENHTL